MTISPNESTLNLQIWKNFYDDFDIEIKNPNGQLAGPLQKILFNIKN